jgi:hypothetical protein
MLIQPYYTQLSLLLRQYSLNRLPGQGKANAPEDTGNELPSSKEDVEMNEVDKDRNEANV